MPKGEPEEVFTITEAQRGLSVEQVGRQRRYLVSMGIRTACVLGAILVPGWPRWVLLAGAVVLPYLAVVIANAGRENDEPGDVGVAEQGRAALPAPGLAIGYQPHGEAYDEAYYDAGRARTGGQAGGSASPTPPWTP
jgi:hypothetical protein